MAWVQIPAGVPKMNKEMEDEIATYPQYVQDHIDAHYVTCTKCPNCGRESHWSNPYNINTEHKCWSCNKKVKMIKMPTEEFWRPFKNELGR